MKLAENNKWSLYIKNHYIYHLLSTQMIILSIIVILIAYLFYC